MHMIWCCSVWRLLFHSQRFQCVGHGEEFQYNFLPSFYRVKFIWIHGDGYGFRGKYCIDIHFFFLYFILFIYLFGFFSCKNLHPVAEFMKRGRETRTCQICRTKDVQRRKHCIHNKRKYKCRACSPHIYFKNVLCYYVQYMLKNKIK